MAGQDKDSQQFSAGDSKLEVTTSKAMQHVVTVYKGETEDPRKPWTHYISKFAWVAVTSAVGLGGTTVAVVQIKPDVIIDPFKQIIRDVVEEDEVSPEDIIKEPVEYAMVACDAADYGVYTISASESIQLRSCPIINALDDTYITLDRSGIRRKIEDSEKSRNENQRPRTYRIEDIQFNLRGAKRGDGDQAENKPLFWFTKTEFEDAGEVLQQCDTVLTRIANAHGDTACGAAANVEGIFTVSATKVFVLGSTTENSK